MQCGGRTGYKCPPSHCLSCTAGKPTSLSKLPLNDESTAERAAAQRQSMRCTSGKGQVQFRAAATNDPQVDSELKDCRDPGDLLAV